MGTTIWHPINIYSHFPLREIRKKGIILNMRSLRKIKNEIINAETGSVTVLVLSSLILIVMVLLNLYIGGSNKTISQTKEIRKIQEEYSASEEEMEEAYRNAANP